MRKTFIYIILSAMLLVGGCKKDDWQGGLFFAPNNFILGLEEETMLWTQFATLEITPRGETASVVFLFKGKERGIASITEFSIEVDGVGYKKEGSSISLKGESIEGIIAYTLGNAQKKMGSIIRSFNISGVIDDKNLAHSSFTITATILDKPLTLSIQNLAAKESEAVFGQPGYPFWSGGMLNTKRLFVNQSGQEVTVGYQAGSLVYNQTVVIQPGETGRYTLTEEYDTPDSAFILTFNDGRVSTCKKAEKRFEYIGLPVVIKPAPFLTFNAGIIEYNDNYECTYTILP